MRKFSLRAKLILAFILVITIPMVTLGGIIYKVSKDSYYNNMKESSLEISEQVKNSVTNYMMIYERATKLTGRDPNLGTARTDELSRERMLVAFNSFISEYSEVKNVYVGYKDKSFYIWPEVELPADYDPTGRPWYTEAQDKDGFIWTPPYTDATDKSIVVISAALPVKSPSGSFEGVMALDLDISKVAASLNDILIGKSGYVTAIDSNNLVMTHPNSDLVGSEISVPELNTFVKSNTTGTLEYSFNGVKKIAFLTTIDSLGWKLLAVVDESEIADQTRSLVLTLLFFSSILLAIAIIVAIVFSNLILKNIKKISTFISEVSRGDLSHRIHIKAKDEIGLLSHDLNDMLDNVSGLLRNVDDATSKVLESSTGLVGLSERSTQAAREVAHAVEEVAVGASKQAMDSETSSKVATEMGNNIKHSPRTLSQ